MGLSIYPVPGKEKSKVICAAFAAGAPKHVTGSVFFGTEGVMSAFQRAKSGTWWYIDNAYTDPQRGQYFRVTKNALQIDPMWRGGRLDGTLRYSDGARFARLGIKVKDWRDNPAGRILVIPQSDDFMKSTLGRKGDWLGETVAKLNAWGFGPRIRVRPWQRDKKQAYIELHKDLDDAALVVTWSSASAITALYEGIPAISESGSACTLTGGLLQQAVRDPRRPSMLERIRFLEVLADNQFTLDEFRDGTAWRWLERSE
jgi:hypothetical protein